MAILAVRSALHCSGACRRVLQTTNAASRNYRFLRRGARSPTSGGFSMKSPAKRLSETKGELFLRRSFGAQQAVLLTQLELAATSITHPGKYGDVTEQYIIEILRRYLPARYQVDSAIVIDCEGRTSDQIDVVVYDRYYTPTLLDQHGHKYVPAEAVYAVFELKPVVDAAKLVYAGKKAASVRCLKRTSGTFRTAVGMEKKTEPIEIIAGIIAPRVGWKNGLRATAFKSSLTKFSKNHRLDCVLALKDGSYDRFNKDGSETTGGQENCLIFFLFRLLGKLLTQGNVPAVAWDTYAKNFKH